MSGEAATPNPSLGDRVVAWLPVETGSLLVGTAVVAAGVFTVRTIITIAGNLPFGPVSPPAVFVDGLSVLTPLSLAATAAASGLTADRPPVTVGLLFVAAFVILGALTPAATLPAVLGVGAGGTVALLGWVARPIDRPTARRLVTAGAAVVGMTLSLAGTIELAPASTRAVGGGATLLALALLAFEPPVDRRAVAVGVVAAGGIVAAGLAAPFAAGATLLVAFGVTSGSILGVALAAGGVLTAIVADLRAHAILSAAGGLLCLCAGMPTTPERAAALVVGLTLVCLRPSAGQSRGVGS